MPPAGSQILLAPSERESPWAQALTAQADGALALVQRRLGLTLGEPVRLTTRANRRDFEAYLGQSPMNAAAVARPDRGEIVILRSAWAPMGQPEQASLLTHEMTHLVLGRCAKGRLPAWLDEGLAMLVAGESSYASWWRLSMSGALGSLLPMEALLYEATFQGPNQALAYAQSLSLTRFYLAREYGGRGGDPALLARQLADPIDGPHILQNLWDPLYWQALEFQWKRSNRTVFNWVAALSGASALWAFTSCLFLLAYWRKRRMSQLKRERFAEDEARDQELGLDIPPWEYSGDEDDEQYPPSLR